MVCVRVGCYVAFRSLKKFLVLNEISDFISVESADAQIVE